jgi:hypothetical protein
MPTPTARHVLNVFLASPGDVLTERSAAQDVVNRLNKVLRQLSLYIDLHVWEDISPGYGDPQSRINPEVDECDLFIGLLWEKWGQPTKSYSSGFQEEFERATTRRKETGRPEIWLVFKSPRLEKLDEPGPQLTEVLKFRELQKSSRELHFATVKNGDEWRSELQTWLIEHAFKVSGAGSQPLGQPQPVSPGPAPSPSREEPSKGTTDPSGRSDHKVPEQLLALSASVSEVVRSGQLELTRDEAKVLTEFDIARLYLLSSTWMARRYTADFLGAHQMNLLYKYRDQLEATPPELYEILRTILQDDSDVLPGWFWSHEDFPDGPSDTLLHIAAEDTNSRLRISVLQLLADARVDLPEGSWRVLPLSDEDQTVSSTAVDYLAIMGKDSALALLERIELAQEDALPAVAATEARLRILIRSDPKKAFADLLSSGNNPSSDLAKAFGAIADALPTENLIKGTGSPAREIRELSVRELGRRGELSLELAETLREDSSIDVRQFALQVIVNKQAIAELERLRAARKPLDGFGALSGDREIDIDLLTLNYCRNLTTAELLARVEWSSVEGAPAYKVLATDRYESISHLIRSDLGDGFERIRKQWIESLKTALGVEAAEQYIQRFEEKS